MRRPAPVILVSVLLLALVFAQKVNIFVVCASPDIHQGDLVITGNDVYVIENRRFDINGSIIVEENATLMLKNAIINFTQTENYEYNMTFRNPANGNPRLLAENTTLTSVYDFRVDFYGNSSGAVDKLEVWPLIGGACYLFTFDSSLVSIANSKVYAVAAQDASFIEVFNSTTRYTQAFDHASVRFSLSNTQELWCLGFSAVTVSNSEISWRFKVFDLSNATATDSTIWAIEANQNSAVWLSNSTCGSYDLLGESGVYVCWYLDIHVIDSIGQDFPSANVTATFSNGTEAESGFTDLRGWIRFTLIEKVMNATADYPVGNYTVEATYETYSSHTTVNMTGNQQIAMELQMALDTVSPVISVLFPENKTYAVKDVPLTFTVNETTSWIGYSLDGQANTTISGNTTLTSLLDGLHHIVVYANDTAGNMGASSTVYFTVDTTPPNIIEVSQTPPENNVLPEDEVEVNATVTDDLSAVKQVILNYTNGNGTWVIVEMTNLEGNVWNGTIPAFDYCTYVNYTIAAEDEIGNLITTEEVFGYQHQYHVIPEFPLSLILPLFIMATLLPVIIYRRNHSLRARKGMNQRNI